MDPNPVKTEGKQNPNSGQEKTWNDNEPPDTSRSVPANKPGAPRHYTAAHNVVPQSAMDKERLDSAKPTAKSRPRSKSAVEPIIEVPDNLYGIPLEEIDVYLYDKTFCVISKRFSKRYIHRFSATKALFIFGPCHIVRRLAVYIATNQFFDYFVMLTIIINCVLLVFKDLAEAEFVFLGVYTLEMIIKATAKGFIMHKFTYLRDPWNWLDFFVILLGYLTIAVQSFGVEIGNVASLRTFRVLRALKTVSIVPGLKTIVNALLRSLRMLAEVITLTLFCLMVFTLFGLHMYKGVLHNRCVLNIPESVGNVSDLEYQQHIHNKSNWYLESRQPNLCGNFSGAGHCPDNYSCLPDIGPNPNYGYTNFDNYGWGILTILQLVTLDFWEDVFNKIIAAGGPWNILFFIPVVFFGSFYLLNLTTAVVAISFQEESKKSKGQVRQMRQKKRTYSVTSFDISNAKLLNPLVKPTVNYKPKQPGKRSILSKLCFCKWTTNSNTQICQPLAQDSIVMVNSINHPLDRTIEGGHCNGATTPNITTKALETLYTPGARASITIHVQDSESYLKNCTIRRSSSILSQGIHANNDLNEPEIPSRKSSFQGSIDSLSKNDNGEADREFSEFTEETTIRIEVTEISDDNMDSCHVKNCEPQGTTIIKLFPKKELKVDETPVQPPIIPPEEPISELSESPIPRKWYELEYFESEQFKTLQKNLQIIVNDPLFDLMITLCIILNTLLLAVEHHGMSKSLQSALDIGNVVFSAVFTSEAVLKLIALGKSFFQGGWNVFDLIVVTASLIDLGLSAASGLSVMRSLRLLRVFKLAKSWVTMHILLTIILSALSSIGNLTFVLVIIIYIFAVIGMQLFSSGYVPAKFYPDPVPRWNFTDFFHSFMMIFRVLCGEWIDPLWDCMRCSGSTCISVILPTLVVGHFMVLNLFLASLLNSFATESLKGLEHHEAEISRLGKGWQRLKMLIFMRRPTVHPLLIRESREQLDQQPSQPHLSHSKFHSRKTSLMGEKCLSSREDTNESVELHQLSSRSPGSQAENTHDSVPSKEKNMFTMANLAMQVCVVLHNNKDLIQEKMSSNIAETRFGGVVESPKLTLIGVQPRKVPDLESNSFLPNNNHCHEESSLHNEDKHCQCHLVTNIDSTTEISTKIVNDVNCKCHLINESDLCEIPLDQKQDSIIGNSDHSTKDSLSPPHSCYSSLTSLPNYHNCNTISPEKNNSNQFTFERRKSSQCSLLSPDRAVISPSHLTFERRRSSQLSTLISSDNLLYNSSHLPFDRRKNSQSSFHSHTKSPIDKLCFSSSNSPSECFTPLEDELSPSITCSSFQKATIASPEPSLSPNKMMLKTDSCPIEPLSPSPCPENKLESKLPPITPEHIQDQNSPNNEKSWDDSSSEQTNTLNDCCPTCCYKRCQFWQRLFECMCGNRWFVTRHVAVKIVDHQVFAWSVLIMICASSASLAFEDIYLDERPTLGLVLYYLNITFAALFSLEMILQWLAYGLKKYFSSFWTVLDFIIVLISIMSLVVSSEDANLSAWRSLRTFRALRPLLVISRWQGMKIVVNALVNSIPSILNVVLVCFVFWLIFSIMGVQLFGGRFYKCVDKNNIRLPMAIVNNRSECLAFNYTWKNSAINFDHVGQGFLALFQMATFEGWMDIMADAADARQIDEQPSFEANVYAHLYFVAFIICGSFFALNLFIGVVIDNFNMLKKKYEGSILEMFLTESQRNYYHTMRQLGKKKPRKTIERPTNKLQGFFFDLSLSKTFEIIIIILISINMVVMGIEHYKQSHQVEVTLDILNIFFTVVFTTEVIIKVIGLRQHFFKRPGNIFDFFVMFVSLIGTIMDHMVNDMNLYITPTILRVVRVFRIGRILRIIRFAKGLRKLLFALMVSIPALFNIGALLCVIMFIYAIIGMNFFGHVKHSGGITDIVNFETFGKTMSLLFRLTTSAGWNDIITPLSVEPPLCDMNYKNLPNGNCGRHGWAIIYLVSYIFITFVIVINMYIAIILENFNEAHKQGEVGITEDDIDRFYILWAKYDPYATQFIKYEELSSFVAGLNYPLGVSLPNELAIASFNLPIVENNKIHCLDILHALVLYYLGSVEETEELKLIRKQMEEGFKEIFPNRERMEVETTTLQKKREAMAAKTIQRYYRAYRNRRMLQQAAEKLLRQTSPTLSVKSGFIDTLTRRLSSSDIFQAISRGARRLSRSSLSLSRRSLRSLSKVSHVSSSNESSPAPSRHPSMDCTLHVPEA